MYIEFPQGSSLDFDTNCVSFPVDIDGKRNRCLISSRTLRNHFRAGPAKPPVEVFEANRDRVEVAAVDRIRAGATGTILINDL
jgi:hypothetical protein